LAAGRELLSALSMECALGLAATILFAAASIAFAQGEKTATINLQRAILSTREGQRAAARLEAQWAPEVAALAKRQADLKAESEKLETESKRHHGWWPFRRTMSRKQKAIEARKITEKVRTLQRNRDDDRAALENERKRILNDLGGKMHALLEDYARDHGYSAILAAGNPESPVVVTRNDITGEIVTLYDRIHPEEP
jgi:outer membrane protein